MTAISTLLSGVSIGEPRGHGRLEIFPLFATSMAADAFILLDEALASKAVEVTETSDSGSVPVLKFLSRSPVPVLLLDGEELIDACVARLHDAVDYVHSKTLEGMNEGIDVWSLMRTVTLPTELRVGQGYGKVMWGVRTIWETYMGWFKLQSTTELHPTTGAEVLADLVSVVGVTVAVDRAHEHLSGANCLASQAALQHLKESNKWGLVRRGAFSRWTEN